MNHEGTLIGNHEDKYASQNPISRRLVSGFLDALTELYVLADPHNKRVLEVGAGEGKLATHFLTHGPRPAEYLATDLSLELLIPDLDALIATATASAYDLPYADDSFDLVICCEVLEHLDDPERGLAECARVARERVLISTPWEPVWRILNIARGKYWRAFGNTPGHVQNFSRNALRSLASRKLDILAERTPLPWTAYLGRPL
jgi:ubiquinone/menaquinone biosynthesis C-methylase UbiE